MGYQEWVSGMGNQEKIQDSGMGGRVEHRMVSACACVCSRRHIPGMLQRLSATCAAPRTAFKCMQLGARICTLQYDITYTSCPIGYAMRSAEQQEHKCSCDAMNLHAARTRV